MMWHRSTERTSTPTFDRQTKGEPSEEKKKGLVLARRKYYQAAASSQKLDQRRTPSKSANQTTDQTILSKKVFHQHTCIISFSLLVCTFSLIPSK
jgi:hypothetical protein